MTISPRVRRWLIIAAVVFLVLVLGLFLGQIDPNMGQPA